MYMVLVAVIDVNLKFFQVNNRFRVPIGTKFYRVKIKPWTAAAAGRISPKAMAAGDQLKQKSDPDERPNEEDRS